VTKSGGKGPRRPNNMDYVTFFIDRIICNHVTILVQIVTSAHIGSSRRSIGGDRPVSEIVSGTEG